MRKIVTAGSILVDKINEISAYPQAGELTQIRSLARVGGGLVPNTGRDVRILAPDVPVSAFGAIGDDDDGHFVRAELERAGMDVSGVVVFKDATTSFTDVMSVPGGERTFFTYPGASAKWGYGDFPFEKVAPGDVVLLGYFLLLEQVDSGDGLKILKELKRIGATTAIDLVTENSSRYSLVRETLPYVDWLVVNEVEAQRIAGVELSSSPSPKDLRRVAQMLLDLGVNERVVIHMPEIGISLTKGGAWAERRSFKLPEGFIQGKTGAGDAYCAGVLTALFKGRSDAEALELGAISSLGALSAPGATDGMRAESELRALAATLDLV